MKKQIALIRSGMMESLQYRLGMFVTIIGNLIYLVLVYSLWKSIFISSGTDVLNGMTFEETMIYLVLASSMFSLIESYLTWIIHEDIQSGRIVLFLTKPMGYQAFMSFQLIGEMLCRFITTFLPTFIVVYFISNSVIHLGVNLIFFIISIMIGVVISLNIDFFVGTIALYTQSIWGVNIMKEVIVLLLSGAVIPLSFFPENLRNIIMYLPFQAIYHAPLKLLINTDMMIGERLIIIIVQLIWMVIALIVSRLFWRKSLKIITVNGG